ncbi:ATP-dependent RNA helicase DDX51 [Dermacentor albipictus]|uniref:ATP-dependent RNA helicase DDX51 n=1 Tax=Dermacentor albipictus TaxID=60249 RepID=UPI0038FCC68B
MEKLYVVSRFTDDTESAKQKFDPDKRLRKILRKAKRKQEEARNLAQDGCLQTDSAAIALEDSQKDGKTLEIGDNCLAQDNIVVPLVKKAKLASQIDDAAPAVAEPLSDVLTLETPAVKKKSRRKKSQQPRMRRDRRNEGLSVAGDNGANYNLPAGTESTVDHQHTALDDELDGVKVEDTGDGDHKPVQEPVETSPGEYYPILGDVQVKRTDVVHRVLPEWLSNPEMVASIVKKGKKPGSRKVEHFSSSLSAEMMSVLATNHIRKLFPVQEKVVPWLLSSEQRRSHLPPRDICVSAPTGSGKTLAYVIPIIEDLKVRVVRAVRAVVVLPVKELAAQVHAVFLQYVGATSLNVQLVTGSKTFAEEQGLLVRKGAKGYASLVDIVVATPGRLLDHIRKTPGFNLHLLKFFVLDEADRVIEDVQTTLIPEVEQAVFGTGKMNCCCGGTVHDRLCTHPLTVCCLQHCREPVQKLLYSATLTQDPDKLQSLMLFQPKLFTATATINVPSDEHRQKTFVGKYTTPQGLSEFYYLTHDNTKPLAVWDLVANHGFRDTLCFTASKEDAHRLSLVLKEMGNVRAEEFSAKLSTAERARVLRKFASGKLDILVCSNVLARGLDVANVRHVICYDPPKFIKTYVHRVGRTARAGVPGTAVTFLRQGQLQAFKEMLSSAGKTDIQPLDLTDTDGLEPLQSKYRDALKAVETIVKSEQIGPDRKKKYNFAAKSAIPNERPNVKTANGGSTV